MSEEKLYLLYRFPPTWAQGGFPFLTKNFSLSVCKRCFLQIHVQNLYDFQSLIFVVSHLIFLMAVISHCDSLSLRVLFSNFQCLQQKILSRWHHFSFLMFGYFTNPPLIMFHCPLCSHPIDSSTTIQLSTDCTLLKLYNIEPKICCILIWTIFYLQIHLPMNSSIYELDCSTYKFTYLRT